MASTVPQRLFNQVMMLDDFTCVYCGVRTPDITIDHFIPQSLGGPDVLANLFACCGPCNNQKSDRPIDVAGMDLCYGRFDRGLPARISSRTTTERAIELAGPLAEQVDVGGNYSFSANEIAATVGGRRARVLEHVRGVRAGAAPPPQFRQDNGTVAPPDYPVTSE